eukprot:g16651.t1
MNKIAECRERSQSAWLHFPHVELVFLLFAFEGAVAAQVAAVRENASPLVFILAMLALILYPVLMTVMVSRSFWMKVRPDDDIVFKASPDDDENSDQSTRGFVATVKASMKQKHSMFSWANKGQWKSVETSDPEVKRERDWFRIGFEPLFVDFTKNGSWFVVYSLIEDAENDEERVFTARYVRTSWARTWCTMLGKNIFACLRDTAAGVNAKSSRNSAVTTAAARTGPRPAPDPSNGADGPQGSHPHRLGTNTVGTVDTPLVVLSRSVEVTEHSDLPRRRHTKYAEYSSRAPPGQPADGSSFAPGKKPADVGDAFDCLGQQREHVVRPHASDAAPAGAEYHSRTRARLTRSGVQIDDMPRRWEHRRPAAVNSHGDDDEKEEDGPPGGQSTPSGGGMPPLGVGANGATDGPMDEGSSLDQSVSPRRVRSGHTNSGRFGLLGRRDPIASAIPRRHAGFVDASFDVRKGGAGSAIDQPPPSYDDLGDNGWTTDDQGYQGVVDPGSDDAPLDRKSRTWGASSSFAKSMRHVLGGTMQDDLPRRRSTKYSMSRGEDVSEVAGADGEMREPRDDDFGSDPFVGPWGHARGGDSGRFGGPIASDGPRGHAGFADAAFDVPTGGAGSTIDRPPSSYDDVGDHGWTTNDQGYQGVVDPEYDNDHLDRTSRTWGTSSSFAKSMRHVLGGTMQDDLPRRRSTKYSMSRGEDVSEVAGADGETGDGRGHGGPTSGDLRRGASSSLGESMRQVLGGAVEDDLPRRRPAKYSLPEGGR